MISVNSGVTFIVLDRPRKDEGKKGHPRRGERPQDKSRQVGCRPASSPTPDDANPLPPGCLGQTNSRGRIFRRLCVTRHAKQRLRSAISFVPSARKSQIRRLNTIPFVWRLNNSCLNNNLDESCLNKYR